MELTPCDNYIIFHNKMYCLKKWGLIHTSRQFQISCLPCKNYVQLCGWTCLTWLTQHISWPSGAWYWRRLEPQQFSLSYIKNRSQLNACSARYVPNKSQCCLVMKCLFVASPPSGCMKDPNCRRRHVSLLVHLHFHIGAGSTNSWAEPF